MYRIALKMMFADRAKYVMLLSGLTFAALLMTQQAGVFVGILEWTKGNLKNMRAPVWVVDPKVEQVNEVKPMRDTDVSRVRSVPGVGWAVPMYWGILQARLVDGTFKPVQLVGLDNATMVGRPARMIRGRIEDLRLPNAVIVDELAIERLSRGRPRPIGVGDLFEMNDKEARIVGICRTEKSFFGYPYIFSTYEQALQFAPRSRKMLAYILVAPTEGLTPAETAARIRQATGLMAYTEEEFGRSTVQWFFRNTGIPVSFMMTITLGFIVGIAVAGQTFYAFILENLRHFGALKAMGASDGLLARMILLQAFAVGLIGYGLGLGLSVAIGAKFVQMGQPPFSLPWQLPVATLAAILLICSVAAAFGIRRIHRLEAAIVFRG